MNFYPHRHEAFLENVADFARAMWTQFHAPSMVTGLLLVALSVGLQARLLQGGGSLGQLKGWEATAHLAMLAAHGLSLFSNSYILEEGRVLAFLGASCLILAWMVR